MLYDKNKNKIEWKYIEKLEELRRAHNFQTHKLSKKHVQWKRNTMNVRIAVQTLSSSVAQSMDYLMKNNIEDFKDASATIEFIQRMNNIFNIFNSTNTRNVLPFKNCMNSRNARIFLDYFDECVNYLKSLCWTKNPENQSAPITFELLNLYVKLVLLDLLLIYTH